MELEQKLELLNLAKNVSVNKVIEKDGSVYYKISHNEEDLQAIVYLDDREPEYYLGGVYNHYNDYAEIDMDVLDELREFVNMLKKEN